MPARVPKSCLILSALLATSLSLYAQNPTPTPVHFNANGITQPETFIGNILQAAPETPDCSHLNFGPHLTQAPDATLGSYVFLFNIHVVPDNDRCSATDRQRLEIKSELHSNPTPYQNYIIGHLGETVAHRWRFYLPAGFQPSFSFTHIHQIKADDGDDGSPLITLTPRFASSNNTIQVLLIDSTLASPPSQTITLTEVPLAPFLGQWVEAYERIHYDHNSAEGATTPGTYSLTITRLSDNATLLDYSNNDIDMWRVGTTVVRGKWGIYRSLSNAQQLRDEVPRFSNFCLAQAPDDCPSDTTLPDFSLTPQYTNTTVSRGSSITYGLNLAQFNGFNQNVNLRLTGSNVVPGSTGTPAAVNLTGLPAAASASFDNPSVGGGSGTSNLTITTSSATPPGNYLLVVNALSADGVRDHVATLPLVVAGTPGDVNGDTVVDCTDVSLVKAAYGKNINQAGYNASADFNGDGFVNIQDLQFVTRQLPAGASCH